MKKKKNFEAGISQSAYNQHFETNVFPSPPKFSSSKIVATDVIYFVLSWDCPGVLRVQMLRNVRCSIKCLILRLSFILENRNPCEVTVGKPEAKKALEELSRNGKAKAYRNSMTRCGLD